MKSDVAARFCIGLLLFVSAISACHAANPPICPHTLGWNSTIAAWAQGAPWIKVIFAGDAVAARATGAKVFYRPWDADSANHDDGCLPSSLTGSQYADLAWAKISTMAVKPEAVSYRNEFIPTDAAGKRTCREFVNYAARLKSLGYAGRVIFGSFGVGWVDDAVWNDADLAAAVNASDGVETHEYFDFQVSCGAPWLAFRHRDIAIANHTYLQSKEWYIGEFGSDRVCNPNISCSDPLCRRGWRDNGKLTEAAYIAEMAAYRAGCANQVVAVFVFQQGDSVNWADFEVLGTSVADWMRTTWVVAPGRFSGQVKDTNNSPVPYPAISVTPGPYGAATADGNGNYRTVDIPPGAYTITASKNGYGRQTFSNKTIAGGSDTPVNFTLQPVTSITSVKHQANSTTAVVQGVVTASLPAGDSPDRIYIESPNRTGGIAVMPPSTVFPGDLMQAQGTVHTTTDGERVITDAIVTPILPGQSIPKPLGLNNLWLGGGWFGQQGPVLDDFASAWYATGLNNVGLLCHLFGTVSYVDPAGTFFYLNDGAGIDDGSGHAGIRVAVGDLPAPITGANVDVVGVSSTMMLGPHLIRLLRPRALSDLSYASASNLLSNPGFESGTLVNWASYGSVDGPQTGSWFGGVTPHSGNWFLGTAANWDAKSGGVYQRVIARHGARYFARAWSRVFWIDNSPTCVQSRVGIDPTGGTDAAAASVVWSPVDTQQTPDYSVWRQLTTPEVTCAAGVVTIFLDFTQTNPAGWHINCFDDAELRPAP